MFDYKKIYQQTNTLSVLLVEDFDSLRNELKEVLDDLFKEVTAAANGEEALQEYEKRYASGKKYDLVISDIQMPKMDGVVLSKRLRKIEENQSIIILSAYDDKEYLLELINIGIAKFITKPIDYDAFFSVLYTQSQKIHLHKPEQEISTVIEIGDNYYWNRSARVLKYEDKIVDLTKHELLLLEYFVSKNEYLCTPQEIISLFFDHQVEMSEKNIRNLIFKLRKKIPETCIKSVYGLGYKFVTGT